MEMFHSLLEQDRLTSEQIEELMREGFTRIPLNNTSVVTAIDHFKTFLTEKTPEEQKRWGIYGPGEHKKDGVDHGLAIKLGEDGSDNKHYFHYSTYLEKVVKEQHLSHTTNDQYLMQTAKVAYDESTSLAFEIAASFDKLLRPKYGVGVNFYQTLLNALSRPIPHAHHKFRMVDYIVGDIPRKARLHVDRSFFSLVRYETGGSFFACDDAEGSNKRFIPLGPNEGLLFFGLKAEDLTDGVCKALWHGSETDPGASRNVAVCFAHANVLMPDTWTFKR